MTSFFLHAWVAELGPPAPPLKPGEAKLVEVAALARLGRFAAAEQELTALDALVSDARERFLVALFRQQVELRRYRLLGGAQQYGGDTAEAYFDDVFLNALTALGRTAATMPAELGNDAFAAQQYAAVLPVLLFDRTYQFRLKAISAASLGGAPSLDEIVATADTYAAAVNKKAIDQQVVSPAEIDRLTALAHAAELRARGESAAAAAQYHRLMDGASLSAVAALALDAGDAYQFPYGDALTFGFETAAIETLRLAVTTAATSRTLGGPGPEQMRAAEEWYARAVSGPRVVTAETRRAVAFRRAIGALQQNQVESGLAALHALEGEDDVIAWSATAIEGIFRRDKALFGAAVSAAVRQRALGVALSFAALVRLRAALAVAANDPDSAASVLEIAADALEDNGLHAASVTVLLQLASFYNSVGRYDAARVASRIALDRQLAFVRHIRALDSSRPGSLNQTLAQQQLEFERRQLALIAGEWSGALSMSALNDERDPKAAFAEADRLLNEWQAGAFDAFTPEERETIRAGSEKLVATRGLVAAGTRVVLDLDAPCEEVNAKLAPLRAEGERFGLDEWLLSVDVANVRCGGGRLRERRRELEAADLLEPFRKALAAVPASEAGLDLNKQMALQLAFNALRVRLNTLFAAQGFEAVARTARQMAALGAADRRVAGLDPFARGYLALAQAASGDAAGAIQTINSFFASPAAAAAPANVRLGIDDAMLQAQVQLCDCGGPQCDPVVGLAAYENAYAIRRWMESIRSGVASGRRGSAELAALEARLASNEVMDDALLRRLRELRGAAAPELVRLPDRDDVEAVVASLPPHVTALVYQPLAGGLAVFIVRRGAVDLRMVRVQPWELERLTAALQHELLDGLAGHWRAVAGQLSTLLVRPALPLPAGETLVVVAAGSIAHTPFDVLVDGDGTPLLERHPILYADHLGVVARRAPREAAGASIAAGVDGNGIHSAEQEARDVAALLHGTALTGGEATKERIVAAMRGARRIHLAMHATLVAENPFESYFSIGNERLRAWELFRDAPGAELIALSACDTFAEAKPALGMAALSGATTSFVSFAFSGGARFVLASLWRARDTVTADLMRRFYAALAAGLPESAALQRAKLETVAAGVANPHYYANFLLSVRDVVALGD